MNKPLKLYGGKLKYTQWAKKVIYELDDQIAREGSEIEKIRLSGYINEIEDTLLLKHQEAIDLLLSIQDEITLMLDSDDEMFELTIIELKGYIEGIELVLNQNRYMFSEKIPAFLLIYAKDESMLNELRIVLHNKYDLFDYVTGDDHYLTRSTAKRCLFGKHLMKMPATKEYLTQALESTKAFRERSILWAIQELKKENEPLILNRIKLKAGVGGVRKYLLENPDLLQ